MTTQQPRLNGTKTHSRRTIGRSLAVAAVTTALAAGFTVAPAQAHQRSAPRPKVTVKSTKVVMPFNLELDRGRVLIADGGSNQVGQLRPSGAIRTVVADQPGASGVATSRDGRWLAVAVTKTDYATVTNTASGLNLLGPRGTRIYADTLAYEKKHNPDSKYFYGVRNASKCVKDSIEKLGAGPVYYKGQVDSHSYSVASYGSSWMVADAGSNTLWKVSARGKVSTLAVLPPAPVVITSAIAKANGLAPCTIGVTYLSESVPTDVEVGRDGYLYVTTLPGGVESPQNAQGALWRVNPRTGRYTKIVTGFSGATNLALGRHGEIYVAELYRGRITVVRHGKKQTFVTLPGVVAVETARDGSLWAATVDLSQQGPGSVVQVTTPRR